MNKVFKARKTGDIEKEDEHLGKADSQWYKLSNEERSRIENMAILENFFEMKKSWKQFYKDGKHRKRRVEFPILTYDKETKKYTQGIGWRWASDLTGTHHILYNILNNKPINIGTNEKRGIIRWELYRATKNERVLKELLVPFGDSIGVHEIQFAYEKIKQQYGFK